MSPNHEFADEEGEITVRGGDRIPGIPQHQFKVSSDYRFTNGFNIGLDLLSNGSQVLRGDESNQLGDVSGYMTISMRARYSVNEKLEVFAKIDNLLDKEYESFGLLGEEPGELEVPIIEDLTNPVFLGAGAPRAAFLGLRYSF